jgi:hypothetical protein
VGADPLVVLRARFTIWSPLVQSKTPCWGSVAYHFMPLPGVIMSNSLPRIFV